MKIKQLNELLEKNEITLTPLRQDILSILLSSIKPLGAYDILNKLKKKRPKAEPPTVYRVLDFLIEAKVIHRIEAQNTYVCCQHLTDNLSAHQAILVLCHKCSKSYEYEDKNIFESLANFAKNNKLRLDDGLIEMEGLCTNCI